jgi:acetyl-CoA/propionyl-CoA carboxylase biotin carboxyl carrier protein
MEILPDYDSMIAKLIVWGRDRSEAIDRMAGALRELDVSGVPTTIGLHSRIMAEPDFRAGLATTAYLPEHPGILAPDESQALLPGSAIPGAPADVEAPERVLVEVNGRRLEVAVHGLGRAAGGSATSATAARRSAPAARRGTSSASNRPELVSTIQGTVVRIPVEVGQAVTAGDVAVVVSAMKMENELAVTATGRIDAIHVSVGDAVRVGTVLVSVQVDG